MKEINTLNKSKLVGGATRKVKGSYSKKPSTYTKSPSTSKTGTHYTKIGMGMLTAATTLNHLSNSVIKAVVYSQNQDLREYNARYKNYLKPMFSLPTTWNKTKISIGTSWFY